MVAGDAVGTDQRRQTIRRGCGHKLSDLTGAGRGMVWARGPTHDVVLKLPRVLPQIVQQAYQSAEI